MKHIIQKVRKNKRLGFTLVEIFIVGVLISLFAGLAIFGVQQQFKDNLRKACIGEVRQIATAMSFAKQDLDFFPRICFLELSKNSLLNAVYAFNHVHTMGYSSNQLSSRVSMDWGGAYFSSSLARNRVSQGRGGVIKMACPDTTPGPGADLFPGTNIPVYDWPADPWGSPYVMYIVKNVISGQTFVPAFITDPWEEGDRFTAIVSYGSNKAPGGEPDQTTISARHINARLYENTTSPRTFRNLTTAEYLLNNRAQALSYKDMGDPQTEIWILDNGSDDIIYEF